MTPRIVHLHVGPDTALLTSRCSACPYGPQGCCVVPPRMALADVGRVVARGGRDWLLAELAAGRLEVREAWLVLTREPIGGAGVEAGGRACVYLGASGCTIPHDRRPATCNFYLCEPALEGDDDASDHARQTRDTLERTYIDWDAALARALAASRPIVFDAATLDRLGAEFEVLAAEARALNATLHRHQVR